jgi:hypothetical protein
MSDEFTEAWGSVQAQRVAAAMSYVTPDRSTRTTLALAAEIDRLTKLLTEVQHERTTLFMSARENQADAERYRWLRTHTHGERDAAGRAEFCMPNPMPRSNIMRGSVAQHLDAAIDADIADYAAVQATAKGLMEKR